MTKTRPAVFVAVLGALLVLIAPASRAQTSKGTVTGTVTDPSGAVVPDAGVTLKQMETNATRETKTNSAGIYRFDAVDLGLYSISVKVSGFKEAGASNFVIQANRIANFDFQLELGTGITVVQVEATATEILQTSEPLRGGNFEPRTILDLPLSSQDSTALTLLLPGVQLDTTVNRGNGTFRFSVNGQRSRANNFMIDGVENNDISVAGQAFTITNPDAIQELSVQTTQFSAEFGRAGGAVVNQITKSGTNSVHGTVAHLFRSSALNATGNSERLAGLTKPAVFVENTPAFTIGGPIYFGRLYDGRNKTFFFAAGQWDRRFETASTTVTAPTDAGVAVLQSLASACPNVRLYLQALGSTRGNPAISPSAVSIAIPTSQFNVTGSCNGTARTGQTVQTALAPRSASFSTLDNNHQIRIDHIASNRQAMSFRWLYDKSSDGPEFNNLDGFDNLFAGRTLSMLFTDTYVIRPNWTNEFRFNYGRIGFSFPDAAADTFHKNLANYDISGDVTGFGLATNIPQFRFANNWQYQDTMSIISGRHTFRFGLDYLRQLARQSAPFNGRGSLAYRASSVSASVPSFAGSVNALANFIDDIGGSAGSAAREFGSPVYHPNLFRQAYFIQDNWKVHPSLTLNLGLRYENFGQPANVFRTPAFTNYDPVNFAAPNKVNPDNNNFGPVVGFAWNPHFTSGILAGFFGDGKTVWRGGYQVTYDTWFNNLLSNMAVSSPNLLNRLLNSTINCTTTSCPSPRGTAGVGAQFATFTPTPATARDPQGDLFDPNIRNPYTERWSFGFQRELPRNTLLDLSYVGSVGHKLFQSLDMNPIVAPGPPPVRFVNTVGARNIRASSGNSAYHSLQLNVRRRYSSTPVGSLQLEGSYTWSHYIDNISDVFRTFSTASSFQSLPQVLGFSPRIDRGDSDYDRRHRFVLNYVWDVRGPKTGVLGQVLGGWSLGGVATLNTGAPFTVRNGLDRNGDGQSLPDRPDIGNPSAPLNTRAVVVGSSTCASRLRDPDTLTCVTANDVHWVQVAFGPGSLPGPNTAGRNIFRGPGFVRFDLDVIKSFRIAEQFKLEYRAEMFNAFNRENFGNITNTNVSVGAPAGRFMNFSLTQAVGRSIRMQLKLQW